MHTLLYYSESIQYCKSKICMLLNQPCADHQLALTWFLKMLQFSKLVCIYMHTCMYPCVHMCVGVCICVSVCMLCVHIYLCLRVYVCTLRLPQTIHAKWIWNYQLHKFYGFIVSLCMDSAEFKRGDKFWLHITHFSYTFILLLKCFVTKALNKASLN